MHPEVTYAMILQPRVGSLRRRPSATSRGIGGFRLFSIRHIGLRSSAQAIPMRRIFASSRLALCLAIAGWQHSPEHNANLLDAKMRRMGIAAANAPGSRFKLYWALDMTD